MRAMVEKGDRREGGEWWLQEPDEETREAREAYEALDDEEMAELVGREPSYYLPRLKALGLKWPR